MKGWKIVISMAVFLGVAFAIAWGDFGITDASTLFLVKLTARTSCLAFLLAFIASPLRRLWQSPLSLWLLQNRRFLGLTMAVSHTYHAVSFITLDVYVRGLAQPDASPFSTVAYVLLFAMTLTSFPLTSKAIGSRAWRILHTAGMYYSWVIFAAGFVLGLEKVWGNFIGMIIYIFMLGLMAMALLTRWLGRRKSRVQATTN
jgi:methionine sulfoxide reductase heme-binding subunit